MTTSLVSRQADAAPAPHPMAMSGVTNHLPEKLQLANALSKAGSDNLPKGYVGNPGACLMAIDYAERMELTLFEVIAEVSFNRGRPTVGARLQKKLAGRRGYHTQKVEGDHESCTVAVYGPTGTEVGRATYTYAQAEALGIIYNNGQSGTLKSTWAGDPAQMLFHRATTRALDHYGPVEYAGAFADAYEVPEPDVLDTIAAAQNGAQEPPADVVEQVEGGLADPSSWAESESRRPREGEPETGNQPQAVTGDELREAVSRHKSRDVSVPKALRALQVQFPDGAFVDFDTIAQDDQAADWLLGWIERGGKD